ncbi:MAG TPA: efflux RND transporter periplasmic adaptor subunit [Flavobacteriales bacterium]|nr:efflux RND transporter periplasmic adaptor subunit [Flavobacteriales bacterium]
MNKTFKILVIIVVALIILAIVGKKLEWFGKSDMIQVITEMVERRQIIETVAANGKIQPEVEVKISPDVSGEITDLLVKEGDKVQKGDLLAKVNPDIYLSNVDRVTASLNTAKANLANSKARFIEAEATFKRNKKLWEEGVISDAEFEGISANLDVAEQTMIASQYNIESANASLKEARDNLSKTMIYAPVTGIVYMLAIEKGERVVGTSQMAGTEMMRLANLNEMEVSVEVNENDIVRVNKGDTTEIEVDAYLDREFMGIVTEVANSANTEGVGSDQVTNFTVKIRILQDSYEDLIDSVNPGILPFRPGMSATVEIRTEIADYVYAVPIQAVTIREDTAAVPDETKKKEKSAETDGDSGATQDASKSKKAGKKEECVFVYKDGKSSLYWVEIGIQDNDFMEIKKGLGDSLNIIIGPYSAISKKLKDGARVEKVTKDELYSSSED